MVSYSNFLIQFRPRSSESGGRVQEPKLGTTSNLPHHFVRVEAHREDADGFVSEYQLMEHGGYNWHGAEDVIRGHWHEVEEYHFKILVNAFHGQYGSSSMPTGVTEEFRSRVVKITSEGRVNLEREVANITGRYSPPLYAESERRQTTRRLKRKARDNAAASPGDESISQPVTKSRRREGMSTVDLAIQDTESRIEGGRNPVGDKELSLLRIGVRQTEDVHMADSSEDDPPGVDPSPTASRQLHPQFGSRKRTSLATQPSKVKEPSEPEHSLAEETSDTGRVEVVISSDDEIVVVARPKLEIRARRDRGPTTNDADEDMPDHGQKESVGRTTSTQRSARQYKAKSGSRAAKRAFERQGLPYSDELRERARILTKSSVFLEQCSERVRDLYQAKLAAISGPPVTLINEIDDQAPSISFEFIQECLHREGVVSLPLDYLIGCECPSIEGSNRGCKAASCACLDNMSERYSPYVGHGERKGTLSDRHLNTRQAIFECSSLCRCGADCRNRLVQHGRKVPLEIFKTEKCGWGLRCPVDLRKGDFIDIYKGEIITVTEAGKRDARRNIVDIYTFALDKFNAENKHNEYAESHQYVIDGEFCGGPSRFINHSCNPNVRIFSVSYHRDDPSLYDLAFFACTAIPAGTELTFNYTDSDTQSRRTTTSKTERDGMTKCCCGAGRKCQGYLWL